MPTWFENVLSGDSENRHGVALSLGDAAALKRLIFEAQTLTIADLRSSIQPGEEAQKKLPAAERSLRIENQRKRLVGLPLLKGSWQVAYALYDKFAHMMETEELRFVPPTSASRGMLSWQVGNLQNL